MGAPSSLPAENGPHLPFTRYSSFFPWCFLYLVFLPIVLFLVPPSPYLYLCLWSSLVRCENVDVCVKGAVSCCLEGYQSPRSDQIWRSDAEVDNEPCLSSGCHLNTVIQLFVNSIQKKNAIEKFLQLLSLMYLSICAPHTQRGWMRTEAFSCSSQCLCARNKTEWDEKPKWVPFCHQSQCISSYIWDTQEGHPCIL